MYMRMRTACATIPEAWRCWSSTQINQHDAFNISLASKAERYTLTAKQLQDNTVRLNGNTLTLDSKGELPQLTGQRTPSGAVSFAAASITFLAIPKANNSKCQ